jgi:hypothetical protein
MKVVCEMRKIVAPWKRNYFDVVPLLPEIINQLAVIKGAAAHRIDGAVDDEADAHPVVGGMNKKLKN